jgi:hypothetical protein
MLAATSTADLVEKLVRCAKARADASTDAVRVKPATRRGVFMEWFNHSSAKVGSTGSDAAEALVLSTPSKAIIRFSTDVVLPCEIRLHVPSTELLL